jgi:hypothetical protein
MKNFLEYLTESQKTYEFRIKLANIDPADIIEQLENALEAYGLESLSKAKRLPIKETDIDFPNIKNCQIYLMDAVLTYPVNDMTLRAIISDRANISLANIFVVPSNHPEELWRWDRANSDIREFKQGEAVLDKPYEDDPAGKDAGKVYAEAGSLLKELNKEVKWEIAGSEKTDGSDTNSIPQGTNSPVGSKQNKITQLGQK